MNKIHSLRAAIEQAIPELRQHPERLSLFVEKGRIASASRVHASFEYRYEVQILLTDFAADVDLAVVACILWAQVNEPEIFDRWRNTQEGIEFEAEVIDDNKVDLAITMPLTERVLVKRQEDGSHNIEHVGEPLAPDPLGPPLGIFRKLHAQQGDQPPVYLSTEPAP
ncbi:phage tail protein [Perlucidibaca piscinae]|uniref:phage tail protein n=1 Tax=Perlucidibaca piscinae TaxID=392589 RepID=UPI0003B37D89|nr:phage tail protein [Perlucidibaca piscinae]